LADGRKHKGTGFQNQIEGHRYLLYPELIRCTLEYLEFIQSAYVCQIDSGYLLLCSAAPTAVFVDTLNFLFCAFLFFSCRLSIPCVSGTTLSPSEIAYLSDMYVRWPFFLEK
jgi:hypothetical protein